MRRLRFLLRAALASAALTGCARDELVSVGPGDAPGQSAPTLEVVLDPNAMTGWEDTVFFGFTNAGRASFLLVEAGSPELTSRGLLKFNAPVQDSVVVIDTVSGTLRFDSLRLEMSVDTVRSRLASSGTTLQLYSVTDEWDARSATWDLAVDSPGVSRPWTAGPGGSLGVRLSEAVIGRPDTLAQPDTFVVFDLTAFSDSLLRLWNDTTRANTGLAIVVADSGRVVLGLPRLRYNVIPVTQPDTAIGVRCPSLTSLTFCFPSRTYIFDRSALPPAAGVLRVGGVDGWRAFSQLVLPGSVSVAGASGPASLRGSTINRAELVLRSLAPPGPPFGAEARFDATLLELVDDFRVLGAKTPVGPEVAGATFRLDPDSLTAGAPVTIDVTRLVRRWAEAPSDSVFPLRFVIRARPEGTTFGFWEFGAADGDPAFRPSLRIVFTPATTFEFP